MKFKRLHSTFVAEVDGFDLSSTSTDDQVGSLRNALNKYSVLISRRQSLTDQQQLEFALALGGSLHQKTGVSTLGPNRFGNEALTDISNIDSEGNILKKNDRRRQYGLANRLWHTDASFQSPRGRYSMLSVKKLPESGCETQFCDSYAAYEQLSDQVQDKITPLIAQHSIAYSRERLGFSFSHEEKKQLKGATHPLVFVNTITARKALYIAAHASHILGWTTPDSRVLLSELMEHATQPQFIYRHKWEPRDFIVWDNRATMHRGMSFPEDVETREMRRVTTLDD